MNGFTDKSFLKLLDFTPAEIQQLLDLPVEGGVAQYMADDHGSSQFLCLVDVDVVQTNTVLADDLQVGAALHVSLREIVSTDDQRIILRDNFLEMCLVEAYGNVIDLDAGIGQHLLGGVTDLAERTGSNQNG